MELTYFGHSSIQLKTGDTTLLVDPFITGNPLAEGIVKAKDLNPDYILLTHVHGDHWGDTLEIAQRTGAMVVATYEVTVYLKSKHGYENTSALNVGGRLEFDWGSVKMTFASHSSSFPDGTYGGNCGGLIIQAEDKVLYDAGDTDVFAEMAWIGEDHDIDLALLPVGDVFTMGIKDSIRAVKLLKPKAVMPIHYNTFPPIAINDAEFAEWEAFVQSAGAVPRRLEPGGQLVF